MSTQISLPIETQETPSATTDQHVDVYDADANQVIESYRIVGKKRYKVRHTFGPIDDNVQIEYFNRARLVMERDSSGESDITLDNDSIAAAVYLHDATAKHIDGVNLDGVRDWKATVISVQSKQDFVNECLLYCEVSAGVRDQGSEVRGQSEEEIVDASDDELCPIETNPSLNQFSYEAIVRFNGKEIRTTHTLRGATGVEMMRYARVSQRSAMRPSAKGKIKTVIPSKAADFAAFYDAMVETSSIIGFAARVPLFVKKAVAETHMADEEKRLRGN
jgi:hypothetical protein